ncbi:hypothetical protein WMY93_033179 [Mugilogobius chulae]|uniref:Uncharacterized protein n=1 Tax=Mugilogobius chulae TaxID=88201 RepID=A0AAW0MLZ0_9GOBI
MKRARPFDQKYYRVHVILAADHNDVRTTPDLYATAQTIHVNIEMRIMMMMMVKQQKALEFKIKSTRILQLLDIKPLQRRTTRHLQDTCGPTYAATSFHLPKDLNGKAASEFSVLMV